VFNVHLQEFGQMKNVFVQIQKRSGMESNVSAKTLLNSGQLVFHVKVQKFGTVIPTLVTVLSLKRD